MSSVKRDVGSERKALARFLVLTDSTPTDVGGWSPFNDNVTISQLSAQINDQLDEWLNDFSAKKYRFYFQHLNHGLDLIADGKELRWKAIYGFILDVPCIENNSTNAEKLSIVAEGLAQAAPTYLRLGMGVLACLINIKSGVPDPVRTRSVFKSRQPKGSIFLKDEIAAWLSDLTRAVYFGLESSDPEFQKAAELRFEESL